MTRSHLYKTIQAIGGSLVIGGQVSVYEPGTTTLVAQILYTSRSGPQALSNPFLASDGVIDFYTDAPQDVDLKITYGSSEMLAQSQSVLPPAGTLFAAGAPITVTNGVSPGYLLRGVDSGHASWVDPLSVVTDRPDTPMPVPSAPRVEVRNGTCFVMWDGLDQNGQSMPADFAYVVLSEVGDLARDLGALPQAGGLVPNADPGVSLQLVAVNKAGSAGSPSALVSCPATNSLITAGALRSGPASAGTGQSLPAAPAGYLPVAVGGITYMVPVYPSS